MSGDKENRAVITLQFGNYSNYVGSHFWNIQEAGFVYSYGTEAAYVPEISNDVLFREGMSGLDRNNSQPTYTPRLVSVDLKGALGCLPLYGDLYNDDLSSIVRMNKSDSVPIWSGEIKIEKEQEKCKNDFLAHLDADETKYESARKKQKSDNCILDDQDKDICEYKEENSVPTTQNYEEYKKLYNLDNQVNTWSDYLSTRFHPHTNVVAEEYIHGDLRTRPFDIFGLGYNYEKLQEDIEDHIRFFAEEADYLKGFHMLVDATDSFSGVGCRIAELLSDEYATKSKIALPCITHGDKADKISGNIQIDNLSQFLNTALAYKGLTGSCDLVTPLSLSKDTFPLNNNFRRIPMIDYQTHSKYHTSAILAAAVDTITLPWRSRRNRIDMHEITSKLNLNGRKVAGAALAFPFPLGENQFFVQYLENVEATMGKNMSLHEKINLTSITPGSHTVNENIQSEAWSVRGINKNKFKPKRDMRSKDLPLYTGRYAMVDSVPGALFSHFDKMKETGRCNIPMPQSISSIDDCLPTGCPFPHIFDKSKISKNGFLLDDTTVRSDQSITEVPILASLQSSNAVCLSVKSLAERCKKLNLNKLHRFQDAGLENDELLEATEELVNLYECYDDTDTF